MTNLEYAASVTAALSLIGFLAAWESESNFGKHLRYQVRLLGWLLVGTVVKPVGWMLGLGTALALLFMPRQQALQKYWQRRTWQPQH